jgi:dimethylamine corrinoid protein
MMLSSYGLLTHDLGVDVAPAEVARRTLELRPDVVGLSGLLTVAAEGMKATIIELRKASAEMGRDMPVIIGGGIVDERTCKYAGADLWANDAAQGVQLIRKAVADGRRHA